MGEGSREKPKIKKKFIFFVVVVGHIVKASHAVEAKILHSVAMERRETNATISDFHATNPFRRRTEATTEQNECRLDSAIAAMFSEVMSDFVPSQEQNAEIAVATSQPNSSRASPTAPIHRMMLKPPRKETHGLRWKSPTTVWKIGQTPTKGPQVSPALLIPPTNKMTLQ